MAGNSPQIIQKERVLDLTKNNMRTKRASKSSQERPTEKRYEKLKTKRDPFLNRARTHSSYTIPNLYPLNFGTSDQGDSVNTTGWQSFGAKCVNNLVNRLVMTLFPPHTAFAKLELTSKAAELLEDEAIDKESSLIKVEEDAMMEHERIAGRVGLGEAIEHLLVGGTGCLYVPDDGNLVHYPLDRYVTRRDKSGNLLELIVEESQSIDLFEPSVQLMIKANMNGKDKEGDTEEVNLYTRSVLKNGFYLITQEAAGLPVGKSHRVKKDNFPFIVFRWKTNYGEDYGRSLVEQYAGDFHVIQILSESIAKGMVLMSDIKYLIRPGSVTDVDHLVESPTGEFIYGNIDDIGVLQLEKYADFTPIAEVLDKYERRVGEAFLLGIQRDAERVTAFEVRKDAVQLEQSLGGAYTLLATTLQRPYFQQLLKRIGFSLSDDLVNTLITTGIEALSKLGDSDKHMEWTEHMVSASQLPPQIQDRMKWGEYSQHVANNLSYQLPFIMTEEEYVKKKQEEQKAQKAQQAQEAALAAAEKAAPDMLANAQPQQPQA